VPLLYVVIDGEIWLHNTAARGHLRMNVEHEARACFEIDEPGEVFPYGRFECDTSIAYRSVIAFGRIRIVTDAPSKQCFFSGLMAKYGDPAWQRPPEFFPRLDQTTVYAMTIERLTGKAAVLPELAQRWPAADRSMSPDAVAPLTPSPSNR
jgi:nitroimidazol reductase NimA-like FMN-containing flavoprotein (pyridoxamine 5'-phosphate oxidase superfamily)